ncbi:ABC transporter permease [Mycetocola reblochoni]|uniref:Oligopeptide transport system permease protein OppC (TC 3.A.1.5.1) n=2 Tax=Mycetocola reblochoni TaxID=331618 RepID=A0A1R4JDN2_9MICO|nr:ABC transporter permease [Mycetocola reblochoni]RLP69932.1 ABC transporter permease [Mycetocola reblochoni]SJN30089.1 Oligopeptide transport system permease protein OppC (TC 3.A.1.5.1) [Mycetocola reblochoni REB411]
MTTTASPTRAVPLRRLASRAPGLLAWAAIAAIGLAVLVPDLVAPFSPTAIAPTEALQPPGSPGHPLGTDESGRDVLSRIVWGARPSLLLGLASTALAAVLGVALAVLSTLSPRPVRLAVDRLIETAFAFPTVLLALLVIVVTGPGAVPTAVAVGLSTAPGYARILREQIRGVLASAYWESAVLKGDSPARLLARTLLPNAATPLRPLITLGVGQAVVWASALSFLGLGMQPPAAEWGAMLSAGRIYIPTAPWLTIAPGLAIVVLAVATTVLGRRARGRR